MKCEVCQYEQNTPFDMCPNCGSATSKPKASVQNNGMKKLSIKKLRRLAIIAAAVILLIVVICLIIILRPGKFEYLKNSLTYYVDADGIYIFVFNDETSVRVEESISQVIDINNLAISYDKKYAVMLTTENELYIVNEKQCRKFDDADNVSFFVLAPFADKVLYIKDYEEQTGGSLCMCNLKKPSSSETYSDGVFPQAGIVFSPKGKSLSYATEYNGTSWTVNVRKTSSSKIRHTYNDVKIVTLSDDAKYIYYTDSKNDLYCNSKMIADSASLLNYCFNENATEVLVSRTEENVALTRLIKKGKTGSEYEKGVFKNPVLPQEVLDRSGRIWNVDSFVKTAIAITVSSENTADRIDYYYLKDSDGTFKKISALNYVENGEIYISDDCETIYFRKQNQDSIKYIKISDYSSGAKEIKIDVKVTHFKMTNSGKYIYFLDDGGTLYYLKKKETAQKIYANIYDTNYYITKKGVVYFGANFTGSTMEMFTSTRGGDYKRVKGADETLSFVFNEASETYMYQTYNGIYRMSSSSSKLVCKFELPIE